MLSTWMFYEYPTEGVYSVNDEGNWEQSLFLEKTTVANEMWNVTCFAQGFEQLENNIIFEFE